MTNYSGNMSVAGTIDESYDGIFAAFSVTGTLGINLTAALNGAGTGSASETASGTVTLSGVTYGYTGTYSTPFSLSTQGISVQSGTINTSASAAAPWPGLDYGVTLTGSVAPNQGSVTEDLTATINATYQGIAIYGSFTGSAVLTAPGGVTISGTVANQPISDTSSLSPFQHVVVSDLTTGETDTVTVTLSNATSGTLSNLDGGSYNAATGVYTVSGTAALVTAALDGLVFQPALDQAPAGQTATTTFTINVTDTTGVSASDSTTSVVATETSPTYALVQSADQAILRTSPTAAYVTQNALQIDADQVTLVQFENGLIASEQAVYTTLAALVTIDAFYGATPSSALLTTVATATSGTGYATALELHNLGYSDPNVWTILGADWGADPTSGFNSAYKADATGTTSGYTTFIDAVYQQEFGHLPTAANLQNLLNDIPGLSALLSGGGNTATPIQVMGGLYGYLLYAGQTNDIGQYATSADAFLQAAANGTVTYGPELTQEFPPGNGADPDVIAISGSNLLTDPGPGGYTIQFLPGASDDTLMLHTGGVDQVSGFSPSTDVLDFSSVLSAASINLNGNVAALGNYVTIVDQGANALVNFDPTGHGGGGTIAVLQGLGSTVTGLGTLIADNAIRIA